MPEATQEQPQELSREAREVASYVQEFISRRFPDGLPKLIDPIIREIVFDAFVDGMRWGEVSGDRKSVVLADPRDHRFRSLVRGLIQ